MNHSINNIIRELLTRDMNRFQQMLNSRLVDECVERFGEHRKVQTAKTRAQLKTIPRKARARWLDESGLDVERRQGENKAVRSLFEFLAREADSRMEGLRLLKRRNAEFRSTIARAEFPKQRRQIILDYAHELGSSRRDLRGDAKAISRTLNEDAMNDRFVKHVGESEQRLAFALELLGSISARTIEIVGKRKADETVGPGDSSRDGWKLKPLQALWQRLQLEQIVQHAFAYEGDSRIHLAALKCISKALEPLPSSIAWQLMQRTSVIFFRNVARNRKLDVWVQCEAMTVLQQVSPVELPTTLHHRLSKPSEGDDIFVRRHAVSLLAGCFRHSAPLTTAEAGPRLQSTSVSHQLDELLELAASDTSDFVRQQATISACYAPIDRAVSHLEQLGRHDGCPKIRASTIVSLAERTASKSLRDKFFDLIHKVLTGETDEFVVRTAVLFSWRWLQQQTKANTNDTEFNSIADHYRKSVIDDLIDLESRQDTSVPMRRWSAQARERIWLLLNPAATELYNRLKAKGQTIVPGKGRRVPRKWFRGFSDEVIGRVLAVMAQDDFCYDLDRTMFGWRLVRGPVFRFRLWRFWFEFRNPATDKRQAFHHLIGRVSDAAIRAPSQIMGELSQTKVPGEPFLIANDGSWRPFLPLVDDFISALHRNWFRKTPIRFFTSQGVTVVTSPRFVVTRMIAAWKLTFGFAKFAQLRNWDDDPQNAPSCYLDAMKKLGFDIRLQPYAEAAYGSDRVSVPDRQHPNRLTGTTASTAAVEPNESTHDSSVGRFFPAATVAAFIPPFISSDVRQVFRDYSRYFGSAYENSLGQLVLFVSVVLAFFLLKHLFANIALRKARRNIPLSIGGWGTRGKSGTERLKAALIGAMGHGLVSKTTGCEAMFIHADAFGEPFEIPLFRPYDKATIWEQSNILRLASKLNPSVFLWECMGLTPSYVEVLSRQWTCDDLATITNTYPDHEDLQGPAGYNVATTISGFVPRKSHLLTTEQEMRPLVAHSCRTVDTSLRGVGWLESGLITDDVQDRFPYKEHPDNIALVSAMGDELGLSYEYCVKAMADYLVPDLGVLKVYPVSTVRSRRIEFTNGMSANERFGCLGNWKRLGYAESDPYEFADTWITGVVNNRADRVPRSRVFANIMVHDVSVDRFFLIGNNLTGLQAFVAEAWGERSNQFKLIGEDESWNKAAAMESLIAAAKEFRQPTCDEHVMNALRPMIEACKQTDQSAGSGSAAVNIDVLLKHNESPEQLANELQSRTGDTEVIAAIRQHHEWMLRAVGEFRVIADAIEKSSSSDQASLEKQFVDQLETWFMRKIVVIENYDATGEDVVQRVVEETPPGFLNRTMGLQNIKGTGLDFIYRFQAWDAVYNACEQLKETNLQVAEKGLQALSAMPVLGQLCENKVRETFADARQASHLQRADIQTELDVIEQKIVVPIVATQSSGQDNLQTDEANLSTKPGRWKRFVGWFTHCAEQYFDSNDAVYRRNEADRIYKDLSKGRISRQMAVEKLRKINKRQKGGWLATEWFGNK